MYILNEKTKELKKEIVILIILNHYNHKIKKLSKCNNCENFHENLHLLSHLNRKLYHNR